MRLELVELFARLDQRLLEAGDFLRHILGSDVVLGHDLIGNTVDVDLASGHARRNADSLEGTLCHYDLGIILRRTFGGTSPSKSPRASAAAGPSAERMSFEPIPAASIINPMMLLPLTSSPSFST